MKRTVSMIMAMTMIFSLLISTGCNKNSNNKPNEANATVKITDLAGRTVEIPKKIESAVALGAGSLRMICYADAQDLIVGIEEAEQDKSLAKGYNYVNYDTFKDLPIIGQGGGVSYTAYDEEIVKLSPDVIITAYSKELSDKLQDKTGIPVISVTYQGIFDENFNKSMKLIGKVFDKEERCNDLVDYLDNLEKDLHDRTKDIPEAEKLKVYTGACTFSGGHGIEGTYTQFPPFNAINAKSVSDELSDKSGGVIVDLEKIIDWNPDIIFLDPNNLGLVNADYAKNPKFYNSLKAVKEGKVYSQVAYNWYTTNVGTGVINAYYAGKIIFPEQFKDVNIEKIANEIYVKMLGEQASNLYTEMEKGGLSWRQITIGE